MDSRFPASVEEIHCEGPQGGLWLRVRVLSQSEAIPHHQALRVAIQAAVAAAGEGDDEKPKQARELSQREQQALAAVMESVARDAVTHYRWPDEGEHEWHKLRIAKNAQDERRDRGVFCIATIDQVAPNWYVTAGNVALRAVLAAVAEVRPLSETGI